MKEEKDLLKKHIVTDFNQTTPSFDFTEMVMDKVELSLNTKTVVKPLIPKSFWKYFILSSILILVISFYSEIPKNNVNWLSELGLKMPNWSDYKTTIKLFLSLLIILSSLTVADLIYRKKKHII